MDWTNHSDNPNCYYFHKDDVEIQVFDGTFSWCMGFHLPDKRVLIPLRGKSDSLDNAKSEAETAMRKYFLEERGEVI
jgi:hypothetical protein